jgi:pilus assembly protein CpaB
MGKPSLGGMLATRQGALILAVLCAVLAAGILMYALSGYKHGTAAAPAQATVLVAAGEIQKGTSGDLIASEKLYKSTPIIASQLAPGAISNSSALAGTVAGADILPGQQLTSAEFTATVGVAGVTALLSPNERALSVPVDEVQGDLDVLQPGDRVDLYASLLNANVLTISLLDPDVLVIKTPSSVPLDTATPASTTTTTSTAAASTSAAGAMVFAVNSSVVENIELTADAGKVWVALRPANADAPAAGNITTIRSVLAQAAAARNSGTTTSTTTGTK